jgi:3-methyladenine DNA glycosylase AlkD
MLDVEAQVSAFRAALQAAGSPARAISERAYLKSDLDFFGTDVPTIRRAAKAFARANRALTRDELLGLLEALWQTSQHELRAVGIELLELYVDRLVADDIAFLERLLRRSSTWAYVDRLSTKVAGPTVERYSETKTILRRWATDDYFWVRRAALLALHDELRAGRGDFELFAELAAPMVDEREFFIRKAIGWVLREVSKKRPDLSYAFLRQHLARVSGLTLREGSKYLPAEQRDDLLGQYMARTKMGTAE